MPLLASMGSVLEGSMNASRLIQHEQGDVVSLPLCLGKKRRFNFWSFNTDFEDPGGLSNLGSEGDGFWGKSPEFSGGKPRGIL
jgi:hypothetical protein